METFVNDTRYAIRTLARRPGFSTVVVVTLALGIGANAAIFSVVNAVLLQPLPYPEPQRLVRLWSAFPFDGNELGATSPHDLDDWKQQNSVFENLAGVPNVRLSGFVLSGNTEPQEIASTFVTQGFFETFGMPAAVGRTLGEADHVEGANRVVVLSHGFWQRRFGADPFSGGVSGVERTSHRDHLPRFARSDGRRRTHRNAYRFQMDEVIQESVAQQRFAMALLAIFAALALILAAVGIYGVIAYTVSRQRREIGIRIALGAESARVLRLVVGRGMTMSLVGIGLGLAAAFLVTRFMTNLLFQVSANDPTTFVAVGVLLAAVAFAAALVPAIRAARTDPLVALCYE